MSSMFYKKILKYRFFIGIFLVLNAMIVALEVGYVRGGRPIVYSVDYFYMKLPDGHIMPRPYQVEAVQGQVLDLYRKVCATQPVSTLIHRIFVQQGVRNPLTFEQVPPVSKSFSQGCETMESLVTVDKTLPVGEYLYAPTMTVQSGPNTTTIQMPGPHVLVGAPP